MRTKQASFDKYKGKHCKICGETDLSKFYTSSRHWKCKKCSVAASIARPRKPSSKPKYCKICGETDQTQFYKGVDNLQCKKCRSNVTMEIYWKKANDPEWRKKRSQESHLNSLKMENIFKTRLTSARTRAKRMGREISIDENFLREQFERQNGCCYYSKIELTNVGDRVTTLSLERLDSNIGYTKENTVLVCSIVNSMKRDLTKDNFLIFVKAIYENYINPSPETQIYSTKLTLW